MEIDTPRKTFLQRPEGKTGLVFGLAIVAALGWGFVTLLPTMLLLAANTLYLFGMIAAAGAILYVAIDPSFRNALAASYQLTMRKLTGLVIEIDPIGIMKNYAKDIQSHLAAMDEQIGNLRGKMKVLKNTIDSNDAAMRNNLKLASCAKESGKDQITVLKARKAGRLKESNLTLQELYVKMEKLYRVLLKMHEAGSFMLEDITDQIEVKEQEYKSIKAASGAFRSAMKVMNGDPDKLAMFQQSLEVIADDMGARVGEIEHFMDMSANFLDSVDVQSGVYKEEGLDLLEQWEKNSDCLLLGPGEKDLLMAKAEDHSDVVNLDAPVKKAERSQNKYRKILSE